MITLNELQSVSDQHLVSVHPELCARVKNLVELAYKNGLYFAAFMGLRTWQQQDFLFSQGRTQPGKTVTNARGGQSSHNYGLAVDLVEDGDPNQAGIQWSWNKNADYVTLGKLAVQCGLEWGGFWKAFKDYPHVTLTLGITMNQAHSLYMATQSVMPVWNELDKRIADPGTYPLTGGW